MFKAFQNKSSQFSGFPALNFQMNNEAYGFSGCTFWLDAAYGLNTQTDLAAVSSWLPKYYPYRFIQTSASNQPIYKKTNLLFNNLPTVSSSPTYTFMTLESIGMINLINKFSTIIFIANYDIQTSFNMVFCNPAGNAPMVGLGGSDAAINGPYIRNGGLVQTGTTENTNAKICVMTSTYIMVNEVTEATFLSSYFGSGFSFTQIMGINNSTSIRLIGNLAEIIVFNYEMTQSQAESISSIINSKYALY